MKFMKAWSVYIELKVIMIMMQSVMDLRDNINVEKVENLSSGKFSFVTNAMGVSSSSWLKRHI